MRSIKKIGEELIEITLAASLATGCAATDVPSTAVLSDSQSNPSSLEKRLDLNVSSHGTPKNSQASQRQTLDRIIERTVDMSELKVEVVNGDDIVVIENDGTKTRYHLARIDAPEPGQKGSRGKHIHIDYGADAKEHLQKIIGNSKCLKLFIVDRDQYGKQIAYIIADDLLVQAEMINAHLAYPEKYNKSMFPSGWHIVKYDGLITTAASGFKRLPFAHPSGYEANLRRLARQSAAAGIGTAVSKSYTPETNSGKKSDYPNGHSRYDRKSEVMKAKALNR